MTGRTRPLEGTRVVEFAQLFPGPYACLVLQSLGAETVKIEPPTGDPTRTVPPFVEDSGGGAGAIFCALNRHKQSVQLDLTTEEHTEAFHKLAQTADIVVDGYRPGVAEKLGVGYETLADETDELVHVHVTGFGPAGEHAGEPGHDLTYQAWTGAIDPEKDCLPNLPTADAASALWTALLAVAHLGQGCVKLEPSLTGSLAAPTIMQDAIAATGHESNPLTGGLPGYDVYKCQDGAKIAIGALEPQFWLKLCQALDAESLEPLGHPVNPQAPDEARRRLASIFQRRDREAWLDELEEAGVPCAPVRTKREAIEAPLELASFDPPGVDGPEDLEHAPALGEHTEQIFAELGLGEE